MDQTPSQLATIYGCCGLFDLCSDSDLMSLSFEGVNKFLDWIGWERTNVCKIEKNFITWVRPETIDGERSSGVVSNPCGESNGAEWGTCDFTLTDFARLRRHGPTRDATKVNLKYCEIQPRYRLDGTLISNDVEFDMRVSTEAIIQDLKLLLVNGNKSNASEMDGLEALVKSGYTNSHGHHCTSMDSVVIDWNHNGMSGGAGITWNGHAIANTYNFVDVLLALLRRIRDRINLAPQLAAQSMNVGDIVFVAPSFILRCLLDAYTCWSVCPNVLINEDLMSVMTAMNSYEGRTFRNSLNGGMFGAGRIFLDGFEIPLVPYEWGLIKGPTTADAYVLTGHVGSIRTISGQYNDMTSVPGSYPDAGYSITDGGRILTWANRLQTCVQREVEMQPRLLMWAPWAQARIMDITCPSIFGPMSGDPFETSFFPESSFSVATCPPV